LAWILLGCGLQVPGVESALEEFGMLELDGMRLGVPESDGVDNPRPIEVHKGDEPARIDHDVFGTYIVMMYTFLL
jgi:hypothetical protein